MYLPPGLVVMMNEIMLVKLLARGLVHNQRSARRARAACGGRARGALPTTLSFSPLPRAHFWLIRGAVSLRGRLGIPQYESGVGGDSPPPNPHETFELLLSFPFCPGRGLFPETPLRPRPLLFREPTPCPFLGPKGGAGSQSPLLRPGPGGSQACLR